MATTRLAVRNRVYEMLGDPNPAERVVSEFRYNTSIERNMYLVAAKANMPRSAVSSTSLVADTYEYTISNTAQHVGFALLNSTGTELAPVPWEQFNAYYRQDSSSPRVSGTPKEYTVREDVSNDLIIRVGPTPDASDTLKVNLSVLPALLTTDAISIPFSEELTRALDLFVAGDVVASVSDELLAKLGVSRSAAGLWMDQGEKAVRDYNRRQSRLGERQNRIARHGARRPGGGVGSGAGGWGSGWGL